MESDSESVAHVLEELGVSYRRDSGHRITVCCPFHEEKTPSMVVYDSNSCYCFGCQKFCWHDELIAAFAKCSLVDAKKKLGTYDPNVNYSCISSGDSRYVTLAEYEFAETPKNLDTTFSRLPTEVPPQMQAFLESKHLDGVAYELGKWRWCPRGTFKCWQKYDGIAIPYFSADGHISTYRLRTYDKLRQKFTHPIAPKSFSLQPSYLIHDIVNPVYFCEGESDSLSMFSIGRNAVCLPGVGAHKQLNSAIMQCLEWKIPKLVFCGDNDDAGHKFNEYAITAAMTLGLGHFTPQLRTLSLPDEYNMLSEGGYKRKDINDFLCEGRLSQIIDGIEEQDNRGKKAFQQTLKDKFAKEKTKDVEQMVQQMFGGFEELTEDIQGVFNYGD